jgi:hypothetical protein
MREWHTIPGYEGYYVINNNGVVRGIDRVVPDKRLGGRKIKGQILKSSKSVYGYIVYQLWKNKKFKNIGVHRLLGDVFIVKSENKTEINHKNGVRDDNRLVNLEWVTRSENVRHGYCINGRLSAVRKRIKCVDTGVEYESMTKAAIELGTRVSYISAVCRGKRKTLLGMKYKYI